MMRRDAIRWSRNQCICMAVGSAIAFVLELLGVMSPGHRITNLAMAALLTLFSAFMAGECHELMRNIKD